MLRILCIDLIITTIFAFVCLIGTPLGAVSIGELFITLVLVGSEFPWTLHIMCDFRDKEAERDLEEQGDCATQDDTLMRKCREMACLVH